MKKLILTILCSALLMGGMTSMAAEKSAGHSAHSAPAKSSHQKKPLTKKSSKPSKEGSVCLSCS